MDRPSGAGTRLALRHYGSHSVVAVPFLAETLSAGSDKVKYFEGTPIPTSILPLTILVGAYHWGHLLPVSIHGVRFHLVSLLFVVSGSLMVSKTLHIPKP